MKKPNSKRNLDNSELRSLARLSADEGFTLDISSLTEDDLQYLIFEFGVYQGELRTQNEELQELQTRLEASRDRFFNLFEQAPVGYLTLDSDYMIVNANRICCSLFDIERSNFLGTSLFQHVEEEHQHSVRQLLKSTRATDKTQSLEIPLKDWFDDAPRHIKLYIRRYSQVKGEVEQYLVALTDITELRKLEQQLVQAKETAETASKAKSDFLAKMSHEIRTPLNSILGMLRLALFGSLEPHQRRRLAVVKESAEALLGLMNDLLDFSKIEAGKFSLQRKEFSLRKLLHSIILTFQPMAQEKGLDLKLAVAPELPGHVVGDPQRLRQIMNNLIGNAIKFTDQGEVVLEVQPAGEVDPSALASGEPLEIHFRVKDTGAGIDPECADQIFETYEQTSSGLNQEQSTGLGLAICKRLVSEMGGSIWLESQPGEGSMFTCSMCFESDGQPEDSPMEDTGQDIPRLPPLQILLAEDQPMNQIFTEDLLSSYGHFTDIAENGRVALEKLEKKSYDLVLMDLKMPEMDGMEATRRIRLGDSQKIDPEVPVIALSAHVKTKEDEERFFTSGFDGYITKPVEFETLFATIQDVLSSRGLIPAQGVNTDTSSQTRRED